MASASEYILFVDDDADDQELFRACCEELARGEQARFVSSGEELCRFLSAAADSGALPSLIVLDVNLPGANGRELLRVLKLHPRYRHLRVVMFSTSSRFGPHYLTLGAEGFYPKPNTYAELQQRIASFFERLTPPSLS